MPVVRIFLAVTLGVYLAGCAQTRLIKVGASAEQVRMDKAQCEFEGVRAAPLQSGGAVALAFSRLEIEQSCMIARGYIEVSKAELPSQLAAAPPQQFVVPTTYSTDQRPRNAHESDLRRRDFGVIGRDMSDDLAADLGLASNLSGVYVMNVADSGSARRAGLQSRDVIIRFDQQQISSLDDLRRDLTFVRAGSVVPVTVWRDGHTKGMEALF